MTDDPQEQPAAISRPLKWLVAALAVWALVATGFAWQQSRQMPEPALGIVHTGDWENGYATARGWWRETGEAGSQQPFGRHVAEIQCIEDLAICIEATAVVPPDKRDLAVQSRIRPIREWTGDIIRYEERARCAVHRFEIDRANRRVRQTIAPPEPLPADCEDEPGERVLELVTR